MNLFLSSENLGKYPNLFVEMTGPKKSVLYIGNAKDYISEEERSAKVAEHKSQFEGLGLSFAELDLREYFDKPLPADIFDKHGMVWCSGGNTFLLRAACLRSGFDKLLIEKVSAGKIAYGGSSAGAILAGPTLQGTEHGDEPELVKTIYNFDIEWSGLGLTQTVCVPHCESDWFGADALKMIEALEDTHTPYVALKDGQVLVFDNGEEKFLS